MKYPQYVAIVVMMFLAATAELRAARFSGFEPDTGIRKLDEGTRALQATFKKLQASILASKSTAPAASAKRRGEVAWLAPSRSMSALLTEMQTEAIRLGGYFRRTKSERGTQTSGDVQRQLRTLTSALGKLAEAGDRESAQVSANGISTSIEMLPKLIFAAKSLAPVDYEAITQGDAEAAQQSICDAENNNFPVGTHCKANCVQTTTGPDPGTIDDEYSCTCLC